MMGVYEVALRSSSDLEVRPVEAAAVSGKFLVSAVRAVHR
jgi:hypothetical protein